MSKCKWMSGCDNTALVGKKYCSFHQSLIAGPSEPHAQVVTIKGKTFVIAPSRFNKRRIKIKAIDNNGEVYLSFVTDIVDIKKASGYLLSTFVDKGKVNLRINQFRGKVSGSHTPKLRTPRGFRSRK